MEAKAMVLKKFNQPLEMGTFPIPKLHEGEVLVKILAAGVCGSDVHMWEGRDPRIRLPMILGHEGVGEIVEMNGEKRDVYGSPLHVGDKVLWSRGVTCGQCYYCKVKMEPSLCPHRWVHGIHTNCAEPPYLTGNYAEYLLLDQKIHFFKIEPDIDLQVFVPASCSGATTAHAFDLSRMESGDSVLIQGVWVSEIRHTHMALQLILSRLQDFKNIITHSFPLAKANDAIRVMKTREAVKAVLFPHA